MPSKYIEDGVVPDEAVRIAKMFSLEIKAEEESKEIKIVSEPRVKEVFYEEKYLLGKIWSLDIHDEFVDMKKDCYLKIEDKVFSPKIKEAHVVKFRVRQSKPKSLQFSVYIDGTEYLTAQILEK